MAKAYTKNIWTDEVLSGAERYEIADNGGTPIESNVQINLSTSVAVVGSPVDASRMNNIEAGIDTLDDALVTYTTAGTTTAYTLTTPQAAALATLERWRVKFNATAGATPTLNRDAKGAKSLKYYDASGAKIACGATSIVLGLLTDIVYDGTDYVVLDPVTVKASGAELDTGTDDSKLATAKAIKDSHNVPSVAPGTSGNVLTSNGTDWTSAAPSGGGSGGGGEGILVNGVISVTVASNNLTLAIKTLAGADPSAGDPVTIQINGVIRTISAALSLTINAGVNTFNAGSAALATKEIDYFPYLSWRAASSAVVILTARFPSARVYSDFSATATNEKYAAFSTAPASTDDCVLVGRFAATLSAGAGYTWTVPTFTSVNLIQRPIFSTRLLTWVPAWTNLSLGNGTLTAQYSLDLLFCYQEMDLIFGSTTSISGAVSFTPPFTNANSGAAHPLGQSTFIDTGTGSFSGTYESNASATSMRIRALNSASTYVSPTPLSSTVPHTWATTDEISITGKYKY